MHTHASATRTGGREGRRRNRIGTTAARQAVRDIGNMGRGPPCKRGGATCSPETTATKPCQRTAPREGGSCKWCGETKAALECEEASMFWCKREVRECGRGRLCAPRWVTPEHITSWGLGSRRRRSGAGWAMLSAGVCVGQEVSTTARHRASTNRVVCRGGCVGFWVVRVGSGGPRRRPVAAVLGRGGQQGARGQPAHRDGGQCRKARGLHHLGASLGPALQMLAFCAAEMEQGWW